MRARLPGTVALVLVVGIQSLCTLFFVWDILAGRDRPAPGADGVGARELIEMGAAVGLSSAWARRAAAARTLLRQPGGREPAAAGFRRLRRASSRSVLSTWGLTRSERDVAWFTIKGLSIAEIARLRGTSEGTVKAHSNAIYRKAGVSGRTQFLSLFIEDSMEVSTRRARSLPRREGGVVREGGLPGRAEGYAGKSGCGSARGARGIATESRARYGMEKPEIGDLVVLTSGSMRMAVEGSRRQACLRLVPRGRDRARRLRRPLCEEVGVS